MKDHQNVDISDIPCGPQFPAVDVFSTIRNSLPVWEDFVWVLKRLEAEKFVAIPRWMKNGPTLAVPP